MAEFKENLTYRKPKNKAEAMCFEQMQRDGWTLTKRGWPDFFCVRDGEFCCVEVKPHEWSALKNNQMEIMKHLASCGVKCYKWTPESGLQEISSHLRAGER